MIRLIVFIVVFIVFLAFIVLNLGNKSDVSFGLKTFNDIPVFITAFASFVLGMLFTLPFALFRRKGRKKSSRDSLSTISDSSDSTGGSKKRRGRKNKKSPSPTEVNDTEENNSVYSGTDDIKKENSSYGID